MFYESFSTPVFLAHCDHAIVCNGQNHLGGVVGWGGVHVFCMLIKRASSRAKVCISCLSEVSTPVGDIHLVFGVHENIGAILVIVNNGLKQTYQYWPDGKIMAT